MEPQLDVRSAMIPRERKSHLRAGEEHKRKFIKSESHPRCRVESAGAGGGGTHTSVGGEYGTHWSQMLMGRRAHGTNG